jgi:hypothetical protein
MINLTRRPRLWLEGSIVIWRFLSTTEGATLAALGLLWIGAFWRSWECRGLFSDGSDFLLDMVLHNHFSVWMAGESRAHVVYLTQAPVLLAIKLGVVDLHWLARVYSFALFGVPTFFYSLALWRARKDSLALAITIAAITTVFMTTSYFIIGEYNSAYACAILAAAYLGTARKVCSSDGAVLALTALLNARAYEHFVYLGPLLGVTTIITIVRLRSSSRFATALYGLAGLTFFCSGAIAAVSLAEWYSDYRQYTVAVMGDAYNARFNIQLDLLLAAIMTLVVCGTWAPRYLELSLPYLLAGFFLVAVAFSPLLVVAEHMVAPPYSWTQQVSRTAAGFLTAAFVVVLCLQSRWTIWRFSLFARLREPRVAPRVMLLAMAMLASVQPWDILLTRLYSRYLEVVREAMHTHTGTFVADDSLLKNHPRLAQHDAVPASLSLIMRSSPRDGLLVRPMSERADPESC